MIPSSCGLDADGLRAQLGRYRAVGEAAEIVEQIQTRLVLAVGDQVPEATINDLIEVEHECCPFFELTWQPRRRRFTIAVADSRHAPDLELIVAALATEE